MPPRVDSCTALLIRLASRTCHRHYHALANHIDRRNDTHSWKKKGNSVLENFDPFDNRQGLVDRENTPNESPFNNNSMINKRLTLTAPYGALESRFASASSWTVQRSATTILIFPLCRQSLTLIGSCWYWWKSGWT